LCGGWFFYPLYKRDVDPAAKCSVFVPQVVEVEAITNEELDLELEVDLIE
jgi:hypothetical protein